MMGLVLGNTGSVCDTVSSASSRGAMPRGVRASAAVDLPEGQRGRCGHCHWQEGKRPNFGLSRPHRLRWRAPSGAAVPRRTPSGHGRRECGPGLSSGSMPGRLSGPESPGPPAKTRSPHSDNGTRAVTCSECSRGPATLPSGWLALPRVRAQAWMAPCPGHVATIALSDFEQRRG